MVVTQVTVPGQQVLADEAPVKEYQKKHVIFRSYQVMWWILGFVEIILGFRFILKLLGANASLFTGLVYGLSAPFALPFLGMFGVTGQGDNVVEWTTLIGMLVYPLLVMGIVKILQVAKPTTSEEVEQTVDSQ